MSQARTVSCDFDGVMHAYSAGWVGHVPADEPPPDGLLDFLVMCRTRGWNVVVHSCRAITDEGADGIWNWLKRYALADLIEDVTSEKPFAFAYVDDRAVRHDGDWIDTLEQLEALAAHPTGVPPRGA